MIVPPTLCRRESRKYVRHPLLELIIHSVLNSGRPGFVGAGFGRAPGGRSVGLRLQSETACCCLRPSCRESRLNAIGIRSSQSDWQLLPVVDKTRNPGSSSRGTEGRSMRPVSLHVVQHS